MSNNRIVLFILAVIVIAVFLKIGARRAASVPTPADQEGMAASTPAPAPTISGGEGEKIAPRRSKTKKPSQTVSETPGCGSGADDLKVEIGVMRRQASLLARGKRGFSILPEGQTKCLRTGQSYPIMAVRRDKASGVHFFHDPRGTATVTSIREIDLKGISRRSRKNLGRLDRSAVEEGLRWSAKQKEGAYSYLLTLRGGSPAMSRETYATPFRHPAAAIETVDRAAVAGFAQRGASLYDIRPKKQFSAGTIPGAKSVPLLRYLSIVDAPIGPRAFSRRSLVRREQLPQKRDTPLVVIGNGPYDFGAYNFSTYLASLGFTGVKWYRGGIDDWYKIPAPPAQLANVKVVEPLEVESLLASGKITLMDVRLRRQYQRAHPIGARLFRFRQARDGRGLAKYRPAELRGSELSRLKEGFRKSEIDRLTRSSPLLVFGQNEFDWRGPKAAVVLASSGYSVYLLRGGYRAWLVGRSFKPDIFPLESLRNRHRQRRSKVKPAVAPLAKADSSVTKAPAGPAVQKIKKKLKKKKKRHVFKPGLGKKAGQADPSREAGPTGKKNGRSKKKKQPPNGVKDGAA